MTPMEAAALGRERRLAARHGRQMALLAIDRSTPPHTAVAHEGRGRHLAAEVRDRHSGELVRAEGDRVRLEAASFSAVPRVSDRLLLDAREADGLSATALAKAGRLIRTADVVRSGAVTVAYVLEVSK